MLQEFTKRLIARETLSEAEAEQAIEAMIDDTLPDAAVASFLTALSMKGETPEEIAGFARVMRRHAVKINSRHSVIVDTAGTGGGTDSFNISTVAAFVIAGAGVAVAKHGNHAVTSRCGSADLLEALGVNVEAGPKVVERCLDKVGLAFMFAPKFHPAIKRVAGIRKQLRHRTIFNILGPLTNPAAATHQLIGVYSPELTRRLALSLSRLGCRRAWVVHSADGFDELSAGSHADVVSVRDGEVAGFTFDPLEFGFERRNAVLPGGSPEQNAETATAVLKGAMRGPHRDFVVLNAAAALHLAGRGEFSEALNLAKESLDSGSALEKLRELIEKSNRGE